MPRQMKETGLGKGKEAERAHIADGSLERLIGEYTREAGVRQLEREIQGVLRKAALDRKSTRLNSSHSQISYAVFCLKKKKRPQATVSSRATTARRDRRSPAG